MQALAEGAQKIQTQAQTSSYNVNLEAGSAARGFQRIENAIIQKEMQIELANQIKSAAAASRNALIDEQLTRLRNEVPRQT
jgi:phage shock protein A/lia operon protein LiaH